MERAELNTAERRIDFDVICTERRLACPHCSALDQGIHVASARLLLQAIAAASPTQRTRVSFKPARGIRTVADAAVYMALTAEWLGPDAVTPARFRIGASGLLDDIEAVLSGAPHPAPCSAY